MEKVTVRKLAMWLGLFYLLFLIMACFSPQPVLIPETIPGLVQIGRLYFIFRPFNSIFALAGAEGGLGLAWSIIQNIFNIFLLFPGGFCLLLLFPRLRQMRLVLLGGFMASLSIESLQLLLDFFFDANRVFEVDDLLTNTFGAGLSLICYRGLKKKLPFLKEI